VREEISLLLREKREREESSLSPEREREESLPENLRESPKDKAGTQ